MVHLFVLFFCYLCKSSFSCYWSSFLFSSFATCVNLRSLAIGQSFCSLLLLIVQIFILLLLVQLSVLLFCYWSSLCPHPTQGRLPILAISPAISSLPLLLVQHMPSPYSSKTLNTLLVQLSVLLSCYWSICPHPTQGRLPTL